MGDRMRKRIPQSIRKARCQYCYCCTYAYYSGAGNQYFSRGSGPRGARVTMTVRDTHGGILLLAIGIALTRSLPTPHAPDLPPRQGVPGADSTQHAARRAQAGSRARREHLARSCYFSWSVAHWAGYTSHSQASKRKSNFIFSECGHS